MENFLIILGVAVGALLLGYLFIKRYDRIDRHFFGEICGTGADSSSDYKPFGRIQVLASAVCGAAICVIMIVASPTFRLGLGAAGRSLSLAVAFVWVVILSYNLYDAIVRMDSFGARFGKFVFLTVACAVGFGFGVISSLLVFAAIVFYIIFFAVKVALSGGSALKPGEIELSDGTVVKNKKGLFGEDNYEAVRNGTGTYDRSGDTFTKR